MRTERPSEVRTDPAAVAQILSNLVDNAGKYAQPSEPPEIELSVEGAALRLRDHGPGIEPADRKHLFEPFRKSAQAAAGSAPGVGLGLALCRRLARQLDVQLHFLEPEGRGACFELRWEAAN